MSLLALAMTIFIVGSATGIGVNNNLREIIGEEPVPPSLWTPKDHRETMQVCKEFCGKRTLEYNMVTGECKCKN